MVSDGTVELMNLIRANAVKLYAGGDMSQQDFHLLLNLAESILRGHEGE